MANREGMAAYRDAYHDLREGVAPFVTPWQNGFFEGLAEDDAQAEFSLLRYDLIDDGYSDWEISILSAIGICDVQKEMQEDIESYEAEA